MKREQSTAARSLRAVSLAITLVSIITFTTIAYSAYQDVNGVVGSVRGTSAGSLGSLQTVVSGNTAQVALNITVPNQGLYPLQLSISCEPTSGLPITCQQVDVTVAPGQVQHVHFVLNVTNVTELEGIVSSGASLRLNATANVSLEPFATLAVTFDLGPALAGGRL